MDIDSILFATDINDETRESYGRIGRQIIGIHESHVTIWLRKMGRHWRCKSRGRTLPELARTYFPNRDPLGQTITIPHWGAAGAVAARIVGVVGHVNQHGVDSPDHEKPQIYYCFYQLPDEGLPIFRNEVTFVVRTPLDPSTVMPAIKNSVEGTAGDQPVYDVRSMLDLLSRSIARQSFPMILLSAFAVLALMLETVGIYGVVSYSTAQGIPEIGIRMALGAARSDILQMLIWRGIRLVLIGMIDART